MPTAPESDFQRFMRLTQQAICALRTENKRLRKNRNRRKARKKLELRSAVTPPGVPEQEIPCDPIPT